MRSIVTEGIICLKDDIGIEYYISDISYTLWENEEFEYVFRPHYPVIDLLDSSLFQGIPGLDLSEKKETYVRKNIIPTFISERSPGKNRENLWQLLEECHMDYLNPLEWLIRTDTKYIGDRLYVNKKTTEAKEKNFQEEYRKLKRSVDINRRLLDLICFGYDVEFDGLRITDENRKTCYDLLLRIYKKENRYILDRQRTGIQMAKEEGRYYGRKPIVIHEPKLEEVIRKYEKKRINADEAAEILNISKKTFYRRLKAYREKSR